MLQNVHKEIRTNPYEMSSMVQIFNHFWKLGACSRDMMFILSTFQLPQEVYFRACLFSMINVHKSLDSICSSYKAIVSSENLDLTTQLIWISFTNVSKLK